MKKNKISNFAKGLVLSVALILAASCNLEDHLVNPSTLTPDQAGKDFLFNGIQLNLAGFFLTATQFGMDNSRMLNMFGSTYENAYTANNFNGLWSSAYSDIMVNANLLLDLTKEDPATTELEYNAYFQGATKIMKAYVLVTLVDYFGKIPYSKAFNTKDYNPTADDGATVYNDALAMLNAAIVDMNAVAGQPLIPKPIQDMYYDRDQAKWIRLANTIKLKIYLQRRRVDVAGSTAAIDALLALPAATGVINSRADEFLFTSSANSQSNPNTYHPWFFNNYQTSAGQYMSNSYMLELLNGKGSTTDPRIRFYFYRQVTSPTTDVNELACSSATSPPAHYPPGTAYCQLPGGYWGRDHLNNEGTPPDGLKRTTYGLYPAGGAFDASQAVPVGGATGLTLGAAGRGIIPIMMFSYVTFMRAEHELTLKGNSAAARVLLNQAVRESINRVYTFNVSVLPTVGPVYTTIVAPASFATLTNSYVAGVLANYDAGVPVAPNTSVPDNQLDVLIREYWVALWGNGVEAYNTIRRTGKPTKMQPALNPTPGNFYRSFIYPAVYVIRNSSAVQKPDNKVKVFWDTLPDGILF